jgi:hypothetical protein
VRQGSVVERDDIRGLSSFGRRSEARPLKPSDARFILKYADRNASRSEKNEQLNGCNDE